MINHTIYCVAEPGSRSYSIYVPVFSGDDDEFRIAIKMNRFYESVLSAVYGYVKSIFSDDVRRGSYRCTASVGYDTCGQITVRLDLSVKLLKKGDERSLSSRKTVTHIWKNGAIKKKIIE